ncbi:YcdB/YcdC domain-containing protein [Brevibacillus choshinensis]|uniref:S-layer homology domain-containing protein n=1 Tax=Brevibacillus choshinensis TaxID=54911 RepID=A0ABX7FIS7_BRECH|nr:YcdB/YcdC domain-containing protein [Brevibacillus choshinensis]QRG66133.1 S-layer homology domain-containing protein [Brevibacillus choshinensis]
MKPWLVRSSSFLLTASLVFPVFSAHAQTPYASTQAVSNNMQVGGAMLAAASKVKLSKEDAAALAQKLVPMKGLELTNVSFRSSDTWRPFPEWSFSWEKKVANSEELEVSYSVSIHANTGEVTAYSRYERGASNLPYAKRVSYEDARKQAENFLAKYNAGKAEQTRLYVRDMPAPKTPLNTDTAYSFRFVRVVDGVLFPDNSADITVNSAGTVIGYSLTWNDVTFEKPTKVISQEEAEKQMIAQAEARLSYLIPWEKSGEARNKPTLAYQNPFTFYIDSADGTALLPASLVPRSQLKEPAPVSTKALPARHSGKALSQEEAVKLASNTFDLGNYELRSANYNEKDYRGNRPVWNLEYGEKENRNRGYAYVSIDATTGDIYAFNKEIQPLKSSEGSSKKVSTDELKAKAIETVRKWTPTLAHQLYWIDRSQEDAGQGDSDRYSVTFQRYLDGIAAASGTASLTFDTKSGELLSYYAELGSETYPAKPGKHLSEQEAIDAWKGEIETEAVYVLTPLSAEDRKKTESQASYLPKRSAKLVYRATTTPFEQAYFYDATTGDWRSQSSGKVINLHRPQPADLEGHPAEKELLLMYEYDALSLIDGKIMPQKEITRGEMIEMLMISLNNGRYYPVYSSERKNTFSDVANGSRYFAAVEAAVDRGLLDKNASKLNPNEPINREELADMIVRAMGYSKLADYSSMFQSKLTDIANTKHRGAIVIATTLGIMTTDKQAFKPTATVSRADAATSFTRFLEKRGTQETNPVMYHAEYE